MLMRILGLALIAAGVGALVYGGISFRTRETVVDLGPVKATVDRDKRWDIPPVVGAGVVGVGTVVLLFAGRRR